MRSIRSHWPEYLIEAWALGTFMVSACVFTLLFEHPASPLHRGIADANLRRGLIGVAMGLTAISLIYSPWGKRSGAHMNPAVTLTFWRLGKIAGIDALFYVAAQVIGGITGVLVVALLSGDALADTAVNFAVTRPQPDGVLAAFIAELVISFSMMSMVLHATNSTRWAPYTGVFAGILVTAFIAFEAPLSGMSMNPARTLASAIPARDWSGIWIYFLAPVLAMQLAAFVFVSRGQRASCAKLRHTFGQRCIHCGYTPEHIQESI